MMPFESDSLRRFMRCRAAVALTVIAIALASCASAPPPTVTEPRISTPERDFAEGFKRYEPARGIPQHEHLLCTVCGRVREFRDERLERMTTVLAEQGGYVRQSHRLVIYGLCGECRRGPAR